MLQRVFSEQTVFLGPDQLTALLDSAQELLVVLGRDGTILYANAAFQRLLGYASEELIRKPITFLAPSNDGTTPQVPDADPASFNEFVTWRCRLRNKDGTWRWFDASARVRANGSSVGGTIVSYLDVTDLHRMEAERQVIAEVVHALNDTAHLDQLLHHIHQALQKVLYAENCFIALHDSEKDWFDFPFFVDQFDTAPLPQKVSHSCAAYVFRTGRAMLIPQTEFDRLVKTGEVELVGSPAPSWLGVPLKTPTETIGVLVVQNYHTENAYDTRDMEFLDSVGGQIALAIERRRAEEALRQSESTFRLLFEHNPLPTWVFDSNTFRFLRVNDAAIRQYGYTAEEFERLTIFDIRPEEDREKSQEFFNELSSEGSHQGQWRHQRKDGKIFDVDVISHHLEYGGRRVRLSVAQDITERHLLEEQLRQAQKMEAVGRLAGGVAHDFNNLLMVIKGHTELLLSSLPASDQLSRKIEQIDRAADRAATLTRQLLAFSRMQVLQQRVMNINVVVEEMGKLLPRLIGEDIELVIRTSPEIGTVRADASQIEQVIMNLAINARDAMPCGGKLVIETTNADLDFSYSVGHPIVQPGRYVLLAVSDTGTGMTAETRTHIFEPFFTTKEPGKGTGLGLSTVYGVVKQSGGFIWVYSEVGKGTSFKIYLPRLDENIDKPGVVMPLADIPRGTETVLLAEDEQDVREVAREFLESGGYKVLEARDGADALQMATKHEGSIDLLVTDMVMPGMTGQELAGKLQKQHSGMRVLFMSGYSEQVVENTGRNDVYFRLLTKPFSRGLILRKVREVLNEARPN